MNDKLGIGSVCNDSKISANDVAIYLIGLSQQELGVGITNLRLQKLLYYAWGYYWNSFKRYLFKDSIEAWKYGPVIKSVYDEYKIFDGGDIIIDNDDFEKIKNKFNKEQQAFLLSFYELMKKYDTWALVQATHNENPWKTTTNECKSIIDYSLMENEFNEIK